MSVKVDITTLSDYSKLKSGSIYDISVKAKADGYEDSNDSDSVKYMVIDYTKIPVGNYTFNSDMDFSMIDFGVLFDSQSIKFTTVGKNYIKIYIHSSSAEITLSYIYI